MKKTLTFIFIILLISYSVKAQEWDDPITTSNWNNLWKSSFIQSENANNAPENSGWFWGINMNHSSNNSTYRYNGQIAIKNSNTSPTMYFRSTDINGTGTWTKVLHNSGNQNINGNLSVGSTTANTYSKFVIKGPNQPNNYGSHRDISFEFASAGSALIRSYRGGGWDTYLQFLTTSSSGGNPQTRMHIDHIGNVGVGTTNPSERLEIYGGGNLSIKGATNDAGDIIFKTSNSSQIARIWTNSSGSSGLYLSSGDNNADIIINESGKVGIGTFSMGSHKLAVEGSIGAREIKVEAIGWSDFVFNDDYKLRTLDEVENFITEYNHLPDVPSEAEVIENGINLGEMDAKLLQKIEELTLYLLEQNDENKEQRKLIEELRREVNALKMN